MGQGFPEDKFVLGPAAFTLPGFAIGVVLGRFAVNIREKDQAQCDHQGANKQPYGHTTLHTNTFWYDEGTEYFVTAGQKILYPV